MYSSTPIKSNKALFKFSVLSLAVAALSGCGEDARDCGGFWDNTLGREECATKFSDSVTSGYKTVSAAELGVKGIVFDGEDLVHLLPDMQVEKNFFIDLEKDLNPADYDISLSQPYSYVQLVDRDGVKRLAISTRGLAAESDYPFILTIKNQKTRQQAILETKFQVKAATHSFVKTISVNNEVVILGSTQDKVQILARKLKSPVQATFSILQKGNSRILNVKFDRDVSDEDVEILWPSDQLVDPNGVFDEAEPTLKKSSVLSRNKLSAQALSELQLDTTPYDTPASENSATEIKFGLRTWLYGKDDAFDLAWGPAQNEGRIVNLAKARRKFWGSEASIEMKRAIEVHTSAITNDLKNLDWKEYEPVIFVHGFNLEDKLGGGKDTWNKMPMLTMQTQISGSNKDFVPFEFHWRTDANFKQVAKDLSDAIRVINRASGKKVHIVAHSFGGVLARTMLQKLGLEGSVDVSDKVASLTTLGSPHSGIFKDDTTFDGVDKSYLMPNGQDSFSFNGCRQISCFQAGSDVSYAAAEKQFQGLVGVDSSFGSLIAQLEETKNDLPAIPINVGIGVTTDMGKNNKIDNGDRLISFAGQRFDLHNNANAANTSDLLNQAKFGLATVTESILGLPTNARPNVFKADLTELPTSRPLGYVHSRITGAVNAIPGFRDEDTINGNGLEAAPNEGCDSYSICDHAGYLLIRQTLGDVVALDLIDAAATERLAPQHLVVNPYIVLTGDQRILLGRILNELENGGYISGSRVMWDAVPRDRRLKYNQEISAAFATVPNERVDRIKEDYASQSQSVNDFYSIYLDKQASRFIVIDKENLKNFVSVAGNMAKTGVGVIKTAFPEISLPASTAKGLVTSTAQMQKIYKYADGINKALSVVNDCSALVLDTNYQAALEKIHLDESVTIQDFTTVAETNLKCAVAIIDSSGKNKDALAILTGTISINNAGVEQKVPLMKALADMISTLAGLAKNPVAERLSGVMDITSAYLDAWLLGLAIESHTATIVSIEQDKILKVWNNTSKILLDDRVNHLLKARTFDYFVVDDVKVVTEPEKGLVGRAVDFIVSSASGLLEQASAVIWRFFSSTDDLINTVAGAINEKVTQLFEAAGEYQARAELRDATGKVLTTVAQTFTINSLFGLNEDALNDPTLENLYEVQKIGLDTADGTLRLPLNVGEVDTTFPYIWIANSGEGTISKLATRDHYRKNPQTGEQELVTAGQELGRYRTGPGNGNPSRTTVDQEGNVWVGNRGQYNGSWGQTNNTITKVGLAEFGNCIDRNGNGKIDTSTGKDDVKDWSGYFGDGQGMTNAQDECVLQHVALQANGVDTPTDIRLIAIDKDNNVFTGGNYRQSVFKVNGRTGQIIDAKMTNGSFYGGLVDKDGSLWAASRYFHGGVGRVLKVSNDLSSSEVIDPGVPVYGIALDKYGKIWVTDAYTTAFATFNPDDFAGTQRTFYQEGRGGQSCYAQGLAVDDADNIFIAGCGSAVVGHYKQIVNGKDTGIQFVANYAVNSGPTGVAVDGKGNVWSSNLNSNSVSRITLDANNPGNAKVDTFAVGVGPYNYSDMTGRTVRNITNRQGTWEATFDGAVPDFEWKKLVWTLKQALPEDTAVTAYAKVANAKVELGGKEYVEVQNSQVMTGMTGRFIKVKFRLTSANQESTPEITGIDLQ